MRQTDKEAAIQTEKKEYLAPDNPHDKGYKRIFSIKKNFLDFINKYVALDWMADISVDDIELIDKEFITDQFDTYESDLVYKVHLGKKKIYLFFLFELQSRNDFTMPFRILVYLVAVWLDYFKNTGKDERKRKKYRLPPIIPMVLHNGASSWTVVKEFKKYVAQFDMFGEYIVNFKYVLVSVKELKQDFITGSNTLIDNILWSDKMRKKEEWLANLMELSRRIKQMSTEDQNEWFTWYSKAFRFANEEERQKFIELFKKGDEQMCSSMEQLFIDERAEGKAEGRAEGKAEDILQLLEDYGEVPDRIKQKVYNEQNLSILKAWLKLAARATSIEEFEEKMYSKHN